MKQAQIQVDFAREELKVLHQIVVTELVEVPPIDGRDAHIEAQRQAIRDTIAACVPEFVEIR